ncbi:MAG: hypothetical protein ACYC2T_05190 [Bacillota bacterium]
MNFFIKWKYPVILFLVVIAVGLIAIGARERTQAPFSVFLDINNQGNYSPVKDKGLLKELEQALAVPPVPMSGLMRSTRALLIKSGDVPTTYYFWGSYLLSQTSPELLKLAPETAKVLNRYFDNMGSSYYGEEIPWPEAKKLLPRFGKATVTDLETGLSFQVQRRAGSYHADVQPLTAQDTATMKTIYNGRWSWRRRAVLIKVNNINIAASMNGMPHGAGAIMGNNFPGHFCIHFAESWGHTRRAKDPGHQLMVAKAAGKLDDIVSKARPEEMVAILYNALKQHDREMASLAVNFKNREEIEIFNEQIDRMGEIIEFKISSKEAAGQGMLLSIDVALTRQKPEEHSLTKSKEQLVLGLDNLLERWFIEASSIKF